ncbi:MAG TPA: ABC transporter permease [Vicinamibacterales bacterium]|nr:ABC transporter permease [Vicinamibacterales bacterium]
MYRWLLRLYPASFRNEYGREMAAAFARERRDTRTPLGRAVLWLRAIADTCVNAAGSHRDILTQDLRYTLRTLRRTPAFALTAVTVVALGIGATTAAFSLADFVLVRPLPFPEADRLVWVSEQRPGFPRLELAPANYRDLKRMATSFEALGAYRGLSVNLVGARQPLRLEGAAMTADVLAALAVRPMIGRPFTAADDVDGAPATALVSHALWQQEFGGDASIVGRPVRLDGEVYTVIGVMPRDFNFPSRGAQLWTAMRFVPADFVDRDNTYLQGIARLRRDLSVDAARTEMSMLAGRLQQQYPKENEQTGVSVIRLRDGVSQQSRTLLVALCGAALCVLLIACANLTNLLLARALARRREMAVRMALGAGRERMLRQLLTESLVVTATGGVLGLTLAAATLPILSRLVPTAMPIAETPSMDLRVVAFAMALTMVTGVAFGIVPLLQHHRDRAGEGLREGARSGGSGREGMRGALVVAEITASVVLLVMCGLLLRALWTIQAIDPGFRLERTLTVRTSLPMPKYETLGARTGFYDRVLSEVRALPGVSSAAYISFLPLGDMRGGLFPVGISGRVESRREDNVAFLRYVTPGVFQTLGIPILQGRDVRDADHLDRQPVAIVSASFMTQFFPGQAALGRRIDFAGADREIVGVVADVKMRELTGVSEPQVYLPHRQLPDRTYEWFAPKDLAVRATGDPLALVSAVRAIVQRADPEVPLSDIQTLEQLVDGDLASRVTQVRVLGAFAVVALVLGGIGIHGLLAFAVSARVREIGIRMALGARRADVVAMIAKRSLSLSAVGVAAGTVIAYISGRWLQSLLVGVSPADGMTFAVAAALAAATAIAGSLRPALRAARVDPVTVIRLE